MGEAETIGQRIKRERLNLGWTQRQLADAVKVGVPHISKVEAGRENPSDELLGELATTFRVDVDELLIQARRIPEEMIEKFARDPEEAVVYLRRWRTPSSSGDRKRPGR